MRGKTEQLRRKLGARGRIGEAGLTLIELLLSLAILAILVGFVTGGLGLARRAFNADLQSEIASTTDGGIEAIASLVSSALRVPTAASRRGSRFAFEGTEEKLIFVGLSEGRTLKGGPQVFTLRRDGDSVIIDVVAASAEDGDALPSVVLLRGVRRLKLGYFGAAESSQTSGWRHEWLFGERLPELVSLQIDFEDARRNRPARIVALRHG